MLELLDGLLDWLLDGEELCDEELLVTDPLLDEADMLDEDELEVDVLLADELEILLLLDELDSLSSCLARI